MTMFAKVARVILDPSIPDHLVRSEIWDLVGRDRFTETVERAAAIESLNGGNYIDLLVAGSGRQMAEMLRSTLTDRGCLDAESGAGAVAGRLG